MPAIKAAACWATRTFNSRKLERLAFGAIPEKPMPIEP
jgi:hypothetical protein